MGGREEDQGAIAAALGVAHELREILGRGLAAVYLHGSAVLGGFRWDRSDLDVLALTRETILDAHLTLMADRLTPLPYPANGLEFSLITTNEAAAPDLPAPRFQLHLTTKGRDRAGSLVDGRTRQGDRDLTLHLAVCRARGVAVTGPSPMASIGAIPEEIVLSAMREEIDWALGQAPLEYLVLTSARVWMFGKTRRITSKVEAGQWAARRYRQAAVIEAALARQQGASAEIDPEEARRFAAFVQARAAGLPRSASRDIQ